MEYPVRQIEKPSQIGACEPFLVSSYNWGGTYRPKTYGCMGYLKHSGLILKMISEELSPAHEYYHHNDPVYKDSAMEVFLRFGQDNPNYFNIEFNANGAILAQYGPDRENRQTFSQLLIQRMHCICGHTDRYWFVTLQLPFDVLSEKENVPYLTIGDTFSCNFYKIKESEPNMHFASWNPIKSDSPNFHLPAYFATARICK